MRLKIIILFITLYAAQSFAQSSYYHYYFTRKLERDYPKMNVNDTLECYYKKGIDSAQIIFLKFKNGNKTLFVNDTLYFFYDNKKWEYVPQKYTVFYNQGYQTLFGPLINDGRCYKKYFDNAKFRIVKYDTIIDGIKYFCIDEKTISHYENYDTMSLIHCFYKGIPLRYHSYISAFKSAQSYSTNIVAIDSNFSQIKSFFDSLQTLVKNTATQYVRIKKEIQNEMVDTAAVIEEFLNQLKNYSKSKIQIIDLWFRGCAPCIRSIPILNSLYQNPKLNIIGVNHTDTNVMEVNNYMRKFDVKYNLTYNINTPLKKLKCEHFPTLIFYNPLNKKYRFYIGYNEKSEEEELKKLIQEISVE